jgi:glutamyl/glutaminyl-tRNA synthetase
MASSATTPYRLPHVNGSGYRGRLAPSPTGFLHVGHASTFWIAFQRARRAGGRLIFRDEDLDPQRSRPEYASAMLEDLQWLGIRWDEGPDIGGPSGPYRQSERRTFYLDVWNRLRQQGMVYPCSCSRKDLAESAQAPHENTDEPIYSGRCRGRQSNATDPAGTTWRFRVPDGVTVSFNDGSVGAQHYVAGQDFGDFIVWRRDDVPSYQLAVVADDVAMGITEVVRGRDLLKSTARQLLVYRALGAVIPAFYHCPLVIDVGGQRLAKRHDAMSLRALRAAGVTPEEIIRGFPRAEDGA